jgi:hypothetical protein
LPPPQSPHQKYRYDSEWKKYNEAKDPSETHHLEALESPSQHEPVKVMIEVQAIDCVNGNDDI